MSNKKLHTSYNFYQKSETLLRFNLADNPISDPIFRENPRIARKISIILFILSHKQNVDKHNLCSYNYYNLSEAIDAAILYCVLFIVSALILKLNRM